MTRFLALLALVMTLIVSVAGCAPAGAAGLSASPTAAAQSSGGVLVRAMTSEPAVIDPQGAANSGLSLVLPYLFDTLVVRDTKGGLHPGLADKWQVSPDGKTITMTLRSGVKFQDGAALTADGVKQTFDRFKKSGTKSPIYAGIQQIGSVEAADALTVRFVFAEPAANFWSTISMPYAGIISPDSVAKAAQSPQSPLVGTGAFKLGEWKAGQSITLLRNDAYTWGPEITANRGAPFLERMVYKVIPDATTQLAALEAGEVDAIFINQPEHRQKLEKNPSIRLEDAVLNSLIYLGYNTKKAPFDDARVRQALSYAVNKADIVNLALGGVGVAAFAPLPPTIPGFDPSLKKNELAFDLAKGQDLLRQAGFAKAGDGSWSRDAKALKGVLLTSNRAPNDVIAALLQSQMKALGVAVDIQQLDSKAVMQAASDGSFDLILWRYDWSDADALNVFLGSENAGNTNRVFYSNPAVDKLLARGARELDETARKQIYLEAQQIILADAPWQPLYVPVDVLAVNKRVQGAAVGYMGRLLVNDVRVAAK